jgi:hypothetical protein
VHVASLVSCLAAGTPAPASGTVSSAASAALGEGGEGSHLSGEPGPHRFPPPPRPRLTTSTPRSQARRAPAARAAGTPRSFAPGAPAAGCSAPSCGPPAPAPAAALRARARDRGVGGSDRAAFTTLIYKTGEADEASKHANISRTGRTRKGETPLTSGPTGSMANAQRTASSLRAALRSMARRARVATYSHGKRSGSSRDYASATGSASSCISKMRSSLSIRGTIHL